MDTIEFPAFGELILIEDEDDQENVVAAIHINPLIDSFSHDLKMRIIRGWVGALEGYLEDIELANTTVH